MLKILKLSLICMLLSSCSTNSKFTGTFDMYGVVIDKVTGDPIEGVLVIATHEAVSVSGPSGVTIGSTITDKNGKFFIQKNPIIVKGGEGGFSGNISDWPSLYFEKDGYCKPYRTFDGKYENIDTGKVITLEKNKNCI